MSTIWGWLDRVDGDDHGVRWILLRIVLPGGATIRTRVIVGGEALIARGLDRVDVSKLRDGEFVEVTYRGGQTGFMEAETIYVRPDHFPVA